MYKKADASTSCNYGRRYEANLDVVSSLSGEVKMLMNCKSAFRRPDFLVPPIDAVLQLVENKYHHLYNVVGKEFSLKKLLEEVCETFLKMGTNVHGSTSRKHFSEDCSDVPRRNIRTKKEEPLSSDSGKNSDKKDSGCAKRSTIQSLATVPQPPVPPARRGHFHDISDISKGTERVKISLVDDVGFDDLPKFNYISQNAPYQNAYVHASLARIDDESCCSDCSGNCLELSLPCACARDTGGEFAYTPQGLLKAQFLDACLSLNENPQKHHYYYCEDCPIERNKNEKMPESCKGHLMKKFIKECWIKCGCNMQCGNRIVQRGISCKLQVFCTPEGKGWGVRSLEALPRGAFVCEYVGEIMTNTELYDRNLRSAGEQHTYPVMLDADWGSEGFLQDEEALCLDATYNGNVARFINHRCFDANLIDIPVEVETPDRHYYHIAFFTKREVKAVEELTWDYSIDFEDHNHPVKAFKCCCGSEYCRDPGRR
ncbi:Pre-SET domain, partial [Dillenia turbinata]